MSTKEEWDAMEEYQAMVADPAQWWASRNHYWADSALWWAEKARWSASQQDVFNPEYRRLSDTWAAKVCWDQCHEALVLAFQADVRSREYS